MVESVQDILTRVCEETGNVCNCYGGFEVTVCNPDAFPWVEVFKALLATGHDVWITKEEDCLVVVSKPQPV